MLKHEIIHPQKERYPDKQNNNNNKHESLKNEGRYNLQFKLMASLRGISQKDADVLKEQMWFEVNPAS